MPAIGRPEAVCRQRQGPLWTEEALVNCGFQERRAQAANAPEHSEDADVVGLKLVRTRKVFMAGMHGIPQVVGASHVATASTVRCE